MGATSGAVQKSPAVLPSSIDRHAVVIRHNVLLSGPAPRSPLQVGNGQFAFNADVTGLQTLYGNTLSTWGWHEAPLPGERSAHDTEQHEPDCPVGYNRNSRRNKTQGRGEDNDGRFIAPGWVEGIIL